MESLQLFIRVLTSVQIQDWRIIFDRKILTDPIREVGGPIRAKRADNAEERGDWTIAGIRQRQPEFPWFIGVDGIHTEEEKAERQHGLTQADVKDR
jgi:hypothetical protein